MLFNANTHPPFRYNVNSVSKKLVISESEAIIVREIFELYLSGYGYLRIIDILNHKGYKTKAGRCFEKNSLHSILKNKYSGVYVFNRSASKDAFEKNNHANKDDDSIVRIEGGCTCYHNKRAVRKGSSNHASK